MRRSLSDIIMACKKAVNQSDGEINICAAVVDPIKYKMYIKNFSELFSNQIEYAKTIILSRTEKIAEEKLSQVVKDIKSRNQTANIITTPWGELSAKTMISVAEQAASISLTSQIPLRVNVQEHSYQHSDCSCHHAGDVFENWGIETPHIFSENEIKHAMELLSDSDSFGTVLRAKGTGRVLITGLNLMGIIYFIAYLLIKKTIDVVEAAKLGSRASHGCIRLSIENAKWVYDNIPKGTKVVIE